MPLVPIFPHLGRLALAPDFLASGDNFATIIYQVLTLLAITPLLLNDSDRFQNSVAGP